MVSPRNGSFDDTDSSNEELRNDEEQLSELTENSINELVSRVYQNGEMIKFDKETLENVKKAIKNRIWDHCKFTDLETIREQDLYDEDGMVFQVIDSLNLTSYNKILRAKFWNRYGRYVLEVLSNCKCSAADGIKKDVLKGKGEKHYFF